MNTGSTVKICEVAMSAPEILPAPKPMQPCDDVCVSRKIEFSRFDQDYEYLHTDGQWHTTTSGESSTGYFPNRAAAETALAADILRKLYEPDEDGFVSFGDIARGEMGQQCQSGSRYVYGVIKGWPNLGKGLRFRNYEEGKNNYHALRIHIEDVPTFLERYQGFLLDEMRH